ncbi:MAG: phytoene desaturase family protein, partial [Gammaproteobacteria bacterium]
MPRNFQEIQKYDAIIVGSGIGGLTSAGLLAKAGQSVLLLERHDRPGGYAHGFRRKRYLFDSGVHLTSGCGPGGYRGGQIIHKVFQALGILDRVEFIRIDPISRAFFPGLQISLPVSINNFIKTLSDHFPDEENGLRRLILLCVQLSEELAIADEIMAGDDLARARERLPVLFEYRRKTLSEVCDKFIVNPKLRGVFATLWPYLGLPPSKVSFLYWSTMFIGYLVDGAYYCAGGFQKFADAMAEGILRHGGKLQFRAEVSGIEITDGKVWGVRLVGGRRVEAPVVIANSDMRHTVGRLVGEHYFPERYLKRMAKMSHSLSIFAVYIATDLDIKKLDIAHESFCYRDFDHDENFARTRVGEVSWISMTVPTLA